MEIKVGTTRLVLLMGKLAFKFPNFLNGWRLFLCGLQSSQKESHGVLTPVDEFL